MIQMMNVREWAKRAEEYLQRAGIPSARLEVLILLEEALKKDRSWVLAHPEIYLPIPTRRTLGRQIKRRVSHEPLAYILGKSEFYGRDFIITPATLQPRPETETMITMLKSLEIPKKSKIADIGTGSGAIAITTKLELPEHELLATEIQTNALKIAKKNAFNLNANISFYHGNLLEPIKNRSVNVVMANLPYVPDRFTINKAAMQEPKIAIFGGEDGLDLYREMFDQISRRNQKPQFILTESLPFQHEELALIAKIHGYKLQSGEDFIQLFNYR